MAESSGFFDATKIESTGKYDREYIAEQFANYFKLFVGNGVFASPTDQCKVVAGSGLNVVVKAGWAFINGYWYHNDTDLTLPITANVTASNRTDAVMLRFDSSAREITAQITTANTVVDRTTYYDLKLAEVAVGTGVSGIVTANITDKRSDETVCGFVTGLIDIISTNDLFSQYQGMFNTWFDSVKGQLTEDAAGQIISEIGTLSNLNTADKTNLVSAINEIALNVTNLLGVTASIYSPSATYALNALVIYNGKLYKCSTAITVAEAWTASHWMSTTVSGELMGLRDALNKVYTATYTAAGWTVSGDGTYWTQTKTITGMTSTIQLLAPMCRHTGVQATDEALDTALNIINEGTVTSQAGSVLIKVWEKPTVDIDIYWKGTVVTS